MNKILNINIGGYPFTIDIDAYERLEDYLGSIESHFHTSEGYEDIISDIEARLAELFKDILGKRDIVTTEDITEAIAIMGTPEEFGADASEDEPQSKRSGKIKTGKRLFRDPDNQQVGGVAAGIAAYFGIEDPLWVRLAFVIFTISGGFGIGLYIILWAIVPEAKTSADVLAMRGEKVNIENMAKIVEEEVTKFSEKISDFSDSKKKKRETKMNMDPMFRKGFHF